MCSKNPSYVNSEEGVHSRTYGDASSIIYTPAVLAVDAGIQNGGSFVGAAHLDLLRVSFHVATLWTRLGDL